MPYVLNVVRPTYTAAKAVAAQLGLRVIDEADAVCVNFCFVPTAAHGHKFK